VKIVLAHIFATNLSFRAKPRPRLPAFHAARFMGIIVTVQQRKCVVSDITGRQCSSGNVLRHARAVGTGDNNDIVMCRLLYVPKHCCIDGMFNHHHHHHHIVIFSAPITIKRT